LEDEDIEYTGIDVSGTPDVYVDLEKVDRLPFDEASFDCVVCADVLEHLDNLHLIFAELLRVTRRYAIISWPNSWAAARVPIQRGYGSFKHHGLPLVKPKDRHKWFFCYTEARQFVLGQIKRNPNIRLVEERIVEKPKFFALRLMRRLRYPIPAHYLNRYAHTYWTVLEKTCRECSPPDRQPVVNFGNLGL